MRKIQFTYQRGWGDKVTEIVEFEDEDDDYVIEQIYQDWVWEKIGDLFNWEEIEQSKFKNP